MAEVENGLLHAVRQLCYDDTGALFVPRELFNKLDYSEPYPIKNISMVRLEAWKRQTSKLKIKPDEVDALLAKLTAHAKERGSEIKTELLEGIATWKE
ncbi:MAG: hypothetical protein HYY96_07040 [Candidatus Tectomicrobia bacterium]|nr:hypothetical protein [Candidatus Tectomicrobia bacterium]